MFSTEYAEGIAVKVTTSAYIRIESNAPDMLLEFDPKKSLGPALTLPVAECDDTDTVTVTLPRNKATLAILGTMITRMSRELS